MNKVLTMQRIYKRITCRIGVSAAAVAALTLASCNVHEWPKETGDTYPFVLYMDFDQDLPLHKEVYYTRDGGDDDSRASASDYDIRYIVNVYDVTDENDENRYVVDSYSFSQPYVDIHDFRVQLNLPEGKYKFRVWCDHVKTTTLDDYFYVTSDYTEIKLDESEGHRGSNELRDAFRGTAYGEVYDPELYSERNGVSPDNSAHAQMKRPMGRYEFLSTDMDEFLDKAIQNVDATRLAEVMAKAAASRGDGDTKGEIFWNGLTRDEVAEAIGLNDYKVVFSYNAFMPSSYNFYTDKPSDSLTGVNYESKMQIGNNGMQLGFDYILVDDETTMNVNMQVQNADGDVIASTSGVEVPVARSKNTVVKGAFLTVSSGGGVSINPDFDGPDFDIEIH